MKKHTKSDNSAKRKVKDKKWYQRDLWIIIFLVVFWPLGVYWMWRHAQWKTYAKIIVSALELLFFIIFVASIANASPYVNLDSSYYATPKTDASTYVVSGTAPSGDIVKVNGITTLRSGDNFKATVPLKSGDNQISVVATDGSKHTQKNFIIHRNTLAEIKARNDVIAAAKKVANVAAAKKAADAAAKAQAVAAAKSAADAAAAAAKAQAAQAAAAAAVIANATAEERSALAQATSYANTQFMSQQGVYDQLVSPYGGQFSAAAAQFAIDNVVADWNANALAKAKEYQSEQNLSPAAIHDQLTSQYGEKFTEAQADYAIQNLNN
jgi:hypothetical protein